MRQKRGDSCLVCKAPACGKNFNARTCAACCAFFRRTISDGRKYKCDESENCNVTFHPVRRSCRYCRYQKCIAVGMLPEKVQRKGSLSAGICCTRLTGEWQTTTNLDQLRQCYQFLKNVRLIQYGRLIEGELQLAPQEAKYKNLNLIESAEPNIIWKFLNTQSNFRHMNTSDKMALFENFVHVSFSAEIALNTVQYGGVGQNRIHLHDGSFINRTNNGIMQVFHENAQFTDLEFIARICLPGMLFAAENLAPSLQAANLNETEEAALFGLLLWDTAVFDLSDEGKQMATMQRQQILKDLNEFYESNGSDISFQLGNLCLLLTPIKEHAHMRREDVCILELSKKCDVSENWS